MKGELGGQVFRIVIESDVLSVTTSPYHRLGWAIYSVLSCFFLISSIQTMTAALKTGVWESVLDVFAA